MKRTLPLIGPLERTLHLRSLPALAGIQSIHLADIASLMTDHYHPAGRVLFEQGVVPAAAMFLVEGKVREEFQGEPLVTREAPCPIGHTGIFGGANAAVRGVAETAVTILELVPAAFLDLLEDHFTFLLLTRKVAAQRLFDLRRDLAVFHLVPSSQAAPAIAPGGALSLAEQLLWLRRNPLMKEVGIGVLAELVRDQQAVRLAATTQLWEAGAESDHALMIVHGAVCVAAGTAGEVELGPGDVAGLESLVGGVPHACAAHVSSDLVAIRIDGRVLLDVMEDHFDLGLNILAHLSREEIRLLHTRAALRRRPDGAKRSG